MPSVIVELPTFFRNWTHYIAQLIPKNCPITGYTIPHFYEQDWQEIVLTSINPLFNTISSEWYPLCKVVWIPNINA